MSALQEASSLVSYVGAAGAMSCEACRLLLWANTSAWQIKSHIWVFINSLIENPAFDSQVLLPSFPFMPLCTFPPTRRAPPSCRLLAMQALQGMHRLVPQV